MADCINLRRVSVTSGATGSTTFRINPNVCKLADDVLFDHASSYIRASQKPAVEKIFEFAHTHPGKFALLVGHTDDSGSASLNRDLAERRTLALLGMLRSAVTIWETLFKHPKEKWSDPEITDMVRAVEGRAPTASEIATIKSSATERASLFTRYFTALRPSGAAASATISFVTKSPEPTLTCGEDRLLCQLDPSGTPQPITGPHEPNRRVEVFFFDSSTPAGPLDCSDAGYGTWLTTCSTAPPAPATITITIAAVDTVRVGQTVNVDVTITPSPLPLGTTVTLELSTTSGTGAVKFATSGGTTLTIDRTTSVGITGVTKSDTADNVRLTATVTGQSTAAAQEDLTVVDAVSMFLKFEIWNETSHAFEPLPDGVAVDLVDFNDVLSDTTLATENTQNGGQVIFNLPPLSTLGDEAQPDIFFLLRLGIEHAGHRLPDTWSTKGWQATDGTAGFHPDFSGSQLGTPGAPLVFRVGLDFHARFKYHVDGGHRFGNDDPISKGVPISVFAGTESSLGFARRRALSPSGDGGEVHGVIFDIEGGNTVFFQVTFTIEDASINLSRATVDLAHPRWSTHFPDADRKYFPNNVQTSIGTQTAPEEFVITALDRNVAMYFFKLLREWSIFLFHLTGGAWTGINNLMFVRSSPSGVAFSWPVGQVNIPPSDHWDRETIMHELSHQIMWKEVGFSSLGIVYEGIFGNLVLYHMANLLSNREHALIEGWAEFMESVFEHTSTPPFSVTTLQDSDGNPQPLGPPPANRGERVEGAFANGLWAIFERFVVADPSQNAHAPETVDGELTTTVPWLTTSAIRDRFLDLIWRPLGDLRSLSSPNSANMFENIRARNAAQWHRLLPELQAFNMMRNTPTLDSNVVPAWGPATGGQIVAITGTDFIARTVASNGATLETTVRFGGTAATSITVSSSTALTCASPAHTAGTVNVEVTTPGGTDTASGAYMFIDDPLHIATVVPSAGSHLMDIPAVIDGTGFMPDAEVWVDGVQLDPATVIVNSPNEIAITVPVGSVGLVDVTVVNPGLDFFTASPGFNRLPAPAPTISNLLPNFGSAGGGDVIEIIGTGFITGPPNQTRVFIASQEVPTLDVDVQSDTRIVITVPPAPAGVVGLVELHVVNPDGQSNPVPPIVEFDYLP